MLWNETYPKDAKPTMADINAYINSPLWNSLCNHLEDIYHVSPQIEYSTCSGAPGWNVKYKKSSRSLCTLYPHEGFFIALVCIGGREQMEAELLLTNCCAYLKDLYYNTNPFNGSRWLMIEVTDEAILTGVKQLISTRVKLPKQK